MSLLDTYNGLKHATKMEEAASRRIVSEAVPFAADALAAVEPRPGNPRPATRLVVPAVATGGSLVPAWPFPQPDGSVVIEFVEDWGATLAVWRASAGEPADQTEWLNRLVTSGDRLWVGLANDVLQTYVPSPPAGSYSMVRHHALMLAGATLWLGADRAREWRTAHAYSARSFLTRNASIPLWDAVARAERALDELLGDPRSRLPAAEVIAWLDADDRAGRAFFDYVGAGSLGIAALLEQVRWGDERRWLQGAVAREHALADFNRAEIEHLAGQLLAGG